MPYPVPRIGSIGRAVPATRFTQLDLVPHSPWEMNALIERLLLDSPIRTRALHVDPVWYRTAHSLTETNQAWKEGALDLAGRALADALAGAGLRSDQLDVIGVTTVTGYATPGLDLLLAHAHGFRHNIHRVHFNCVGCHAAVPLLRVISDHVARRPGTVGVAVAVEVCSACFSSDSDPQNVIASTLFADGAACATIGVDLDGPALLDFGSAFDFEAIDALGFTLTGEGFRIVLDPSIPESIARSIGGVVDDLLARNNLSRADVALWGLHPGGSRVVDAAQVALGLSDEQLLPTRRTLRNYGNMSSPTILFVLAEALSAWDPPAGTYGVIAAFGPGLGVEAALLQF